MVSLRILSCKALFNSLDVRVGMSSEDYIDSVRESISRQLAEDIVASGVGLDVVEVNHPPRTEVILEGAWISKEDVISVLQLQQEVKQLRQWASTISTTPSNP